MGRGIGRTFADRIGWGVSCADPGDTSCIDASVAGMPALRHRREYDVPVL
ncbi:hypothetical protein [Austwickia sp. TVS 96-490-7B]|nr:hypothetical protein [Austwickia sp. TVS 96-490-7B]